MTVIEEQHDRKIRITKLKPSEKEWSYSLIYSHLAGLVCGQVRIHSQHSYIALMRENLINNSEKVSV